MDRRAQSGLDTGQVSLRELMRRIVVGASLLLALVLWLDLTPWVRGGFGWRWPYDPVTFERAIPLALVLVIYLAGSILIWQRRGALMWAFAGTVAVSLTVLALRGDGVFFELLARTMGRDVNGTHWAAARIDWQSDTWYDWWEIAHEPGTYSIHVAVAPPGLPMLYSLLNAGFDAIPAAADPLQRFLLPYQCHNYNLLGYSSGQWASAMLGILTPVIAGLTVFVLYGLTRSRTAMLWWPLIPALGLFAGTWYTVFPLVVLVAFGLLKRGLAHGPFWLVTAGLIAGLGTFANYVFIAVTGFYGFYTLTHYGLRERGTRPIYRPILVGVWFGLGLTLPWLAYWLYTSVPPWDIFSASFDLHLELERDYLPWVFLHPWDWTLFTGLALVLVWLGGLWRQRRNPPVLALALLLTVVTLAVSGTGRGESGRVWLVFTPLLLIAAAEMLPRDGLKREWFIVAASQAVLLLALAATVSAVGHDLEQPPDPPQLAGVDWVDLDSVFYDGRTGVVFRLAGWHGQVDNGTVLLSLRWQGLERPTDVYWFGAVPVDPAGRSGDSLVWQPEAGYPTTCWANGQMIEDQVRVPLPGENGPWWVSLAVFGDDTQTEGRLRVRLADGREDVQVGLGPIE